jgi:phosphatidylglycerophosphate synthase
VSQRIGSVLAAIAGNSGAHPTVLTMGSLVFGVASSVVAAFAGVRSSLVLGLVALLGWQLAYALDCADGQLARATGKTSPYGARVDLLVDFAVQVSVVSAVVTIVDHWQHPHPAVLGAFAAVWMVNLFTSALAGGEGSTSLLESQSPAVQVIKLLRDYGAVIGALGLLVMLAPRAVVLFLAGYLLLNALFLVASIARAAQLSMRTG